MKCNEINIRDPFVVVKDGKYYMYGTRATQTAGFDVYVSEDLENWSEPHECFNSEKFGMNIQVNWAPEVHEYKGAYYMFATFTRASNNLRGTFILKADSLMGPFVPHSKGQATPEDWECLDGTLYVAPDGTPYIVFCHEHTQILDGTICYTRLSDDLTEAVGETVTLFKASEGKSVDAVDTEGKHFVTDGPFMYRSGTGELFMIWSSFIHGDYAVYPVKFAGGELGTKFEFMDPIVTSNGGHGMIFRADDRLLLSLHTPNRSGAERPCFMELLDLGDRIVVK